MRDGNNSFILTLLFDNVAGDRGYISMSTQFSGVSSKTNLSVTLGLTTPGAGR